MNEPMMDNTAGTDGTYNDMDLPGIDPLDRGEGRSRGLIALVIVAIAAVSIAWIYVIFFYRPELLIDEIADRTFPEAAEKICTSVVDQLEELTPAALARSPEERADEVEQSNEILAVMIDDLREIVPADPPEVNEAVSEWLDDWTTYLGDREDYVTNLRDDPDARFLETAKGGPSKGITRAITSFAQVNRMESCSPPADLS